LWQGERGVFLGVKGTALRERSSIRSNAATEDRRPAGGFMADGEALAEPYAWHRSVNGMGLLRRGAAWRPSVFLKKTLVKEFTMLQFPACFSRAGG